MRTGTTVADDIDRAVMVLSDYYDDAERAFGRASVDRMKRALAKHETEVRESIARELRESPLDDDPSMKLSHIVWRDGQRQHAARIAEGRTS